MRKDVRFGLAIGGILLAVLIVYVLVVPNNSTKPGADLAQNDQPPVENITPVTPPATDSKDTTPAVDTGTQVASNDHATTPARTTDWDRLLNHDPMLAATDVQPAAGTNTTSVTTPAGGSGNRTVTFVDGVVEPPHRDSQVVTPEADRATGSMTSAGGAEVTNLGTSTTQPTTPVGNARTHSVRAGETLSSIAAATYGNARYYTLIAKANPQIDPNRLKVGTTINLPPADQAKTTDHPAAAAAAATPLDATKEYRVQPGDRLENIAVKLYGKPEKWQAIYDLNASTIGSDPGRLKVGQILKLPDAPTLH